MVRTLTRLALISLALGLTAGCAQGPEVAVVLMGDEAVVSDGLDAVRVGVRRGLVDGPEAFQAMSLDEDATFMTEMRLGEAFVIDVWGCPSADDCAGGTVVARGCAGPLAVASPNEVSAIGIDMVALDDAHGCPEGMQALSDDDGEGEPQPVLLTVDASRLR